MKNKTKEELLPLMTDYLATSPDCGSGRHFLNGFQKAEQILLPIINKFEEENTWIEVSETSPMPDYNRGCLVIIKDGGYDFAVPAMLDAGKGGDEKEKWIALDDYNDLEAPQKFEGKTDYPKVTHWRYAPASPPGTEWFEQLMKPPINNGEPK